MTANATRSPAPRNALAVGRLSDRVFGVGQNPWQQLGALVTATGIYLYAAFDTCAISAYRSIALIGDCWTAGICAGSSAAREAGPMCAFDSTSLGAQFR